MRIRTIKPEFWTSDDITSLPIFTRLLFIGLWSYVDDNGVGRDEEHLIASTLFPRDLYDSFQECSGNVRGALSQLSDAGLIVRYEDDGKHFFQIVNWKKHQRIDKPQRGRFPQYDAEKHHSKNVPGMFQEDSTPGTEEQRNRGTGEQGSNEDLTVFMSEIGEPITDAPTDDREDVEAVCEHMADSVEERTGKRPRITAKWRTAARLMIDRDKRPVEHIHHAIDWSARDSFWSSNILSLPKLRDQYDRLALQAQRGNRSTVTKAEEFRARQRARAEAIDAAYLAQQAQTLAIEGGEA